MTTFAIAYMVVWLAVVLYLARMGSCQRQLAARIESLRTQLEEPSREQKPKSKAA